MPESSWVDATVSALAPLRLRLPGDLTDVPYEPDCLIDTAALSVGDRVRCELSQGRIIVHGRARGVKFASSPTTVAGAATDQVVTPAGLKAAMNDASNGYRLRQTLYLTSGTTFSKASYPWLRAIKVMLVGGGGGGGGAAATSASMQSFGQGGGGAGYAEAFITNIAGLAASVTVTVGAGGSATSGSAGGAGGASSFGSLVAADGGAGGSVKPNNAYTAYVVGGLPGVGTAGDLLISGSGGSTGTGDGNGLSASGAGGASRLGGGGRSNGTGAGNSGTIGVAGGNYGGGGGGASNNAGSSARAGGAGAPGIVIVELYA